MAFTYQPILEHGEDKTAYQLLTKDGVETLETAGRKILRVKPEVLTRLAKEAFREISFYLRTAHLEKVAKIIDDPEATDNDRFVAATLLQNAAIAAKGELPMCQDTGTASIMAYKGEGVWTECDDAEAISRGVYEVFQEKNLRYSQMAPLSMFEERNTGSNLPAQIDILAEPGNEYHFLFVAKGGGSANKFFLHQKSKSLLNEVSLEKFVREELFSFGTSACPPYHIAVVIGGTSAEACMKTAKLASTGYLDDLPDSGNELGRAFRDKAWEERIFELAQASRVGAQFGGKYLAHDVRVIRLPRHGASCPVALGVSCSADRNIKAKITSGGVFLETLEKNPARFVPPASKLKLAPPVKVNLNRPMPDILAELSQYPVKTRLSLSGTLIVARDIAHAKLKELLDAGKPMPSYFIDHPIYYAGPAKTPQGMVSGSFGPTTAGRMDSYVAEFMAKGASRIMLAKGNRSRAVAEACQKYMGFYLGSIGGPAAIIAQDNIKSVELVDFPELGMEAVRKIEVLDFPAFIVTDDKGNDFFADLKP